MNCASDNHLLTRSFAVSMAVLTWISFAPQASRAQEQTEADHAFVLEAGLAGERGIRHGSSNFGTTIAVEATPLEEWLELEFGVTALVTGAHTELSADLIFKKPFRLSPTVEFMIGLGPERGRSHSIEAVLDFMVWRHQDTGWYIEPGWSRYAGSGERSVSLNGGLLFGWH